MKSLKQAVDAALKAIRVRRAEREREPFLSQGTFYPWLSRGSTFDAPEDCEMNSGERLVDAALNGIADDLERRGDAEGAEGLRRVAVQVLRREFGQTKKESQS